MIIVTCDRKELLLDCVASLERQTVVDFETIVVDNGKDDVAEPLAGRPLLYIKCPGNLMPSEGRNIGTHFARAKVVAFLDDDTLAADDYIESILKAFNEYP